MTVNTKLLKTWLWSRPQSVKNLAKEFPLGYQTEDGLFVIGYTENDQLIVSTVAIDKDYDAAMNSRRYVCAKHLR